MRAIREAGDEEDTTDSGAHTSVNAHIANKRFHFHLAVHSKSILIVFFFPPPFASPSKPNHSPLPRQTGSRNRGPTRMPPRSPDRVLNCTNLTFTFRGDAVSTPPKPLVSQSCCDLYPSRCGSGVVVRILWARATFPTFVPSLAPCTRGWNKGLDGRQDCTKSTFLTITCVFSLFKNFPEKSILCFAAGQ